MSQIASIPANGVQVEKPVGRYVYFFVRTAANPFEASFDNGMTWQKCYQNDQFKPERLRDRILFRAFEGVAVDVTFDVGNSQFTAQSTAVTGSVTSTMANNIADNVAVIPLQFAKVGGVGAAAKLSNAALYFRWALFIAQQDLLGTPNVGDVKLGFLGGANQQPIVLSPGDQYVLPIPVGAKVDFQNVWLAIANAGDGVVAIYV